MNVYTLANGTTQIAVSQMVPIPVIISRSYKRTHRVVGFLVLRLVSALPSAPALIQTSQVETWCGQTQLLANASLLIRPPETRDVHLVPVEVI